MKDFVLWYNQLASPPIMLNLEMIMWLPGVRMFESPFGSMLERGGNVHNASLTTHPHHLPDTSSPPTLEANFITTRE